MPDNSEASASRPRRPQTPWDNSEVRERLRRAIRALEGRPEMLEDAADRLPFGLSAVDAALGGGLPRAALHEIVASGESESASATGFALALAARAAAGRAVLWIAEDMAQRESGVPYGPGIEEMGLGADTVLLVAAAHPREVLWAMEEALHCRAVGAVLGEIRKADAVDGVASRRLSLAATHERRLALLLRPQPAVRPAVAAATRWIVGAAPSVLAAGERMAQGAPAFAVRLVRNRQGRLGSWTLEWNRAEHRFALAPAHSQPLAAAPFDRPSPAAVA